MTKEINNNSLWVKRCAEIASGEAKDNLIAEILKMDESRIDDLKEVISLQGICPTTCRTTAINRLAGLMGKESKTFLKPFANMEIELDDRVRVRAFIWLNVFSSSEERKRLDILASMDPDPILRWYADLRRKETT